MSVRVRPKDYFVEKGGNCVRIKAERVAEADKHILLINLRVEAILFYVEAKNPGLAALLFYFEAKNPSVEANEVLSE